MKISSFRGPDLDIRGDSLITVMISMGVMGIFIAGMMTSYNTMIKGNRTISSKNEIEDVKNTLRLALSSGNACALNLNTNLPSDPISEFKYLNAAGTALSSNVVVKTGNTYGGANLTSMGLTGLTASGSDLIGSLELKFDFGTDASGASKIYGGQIITRTLPIKVTLDTATGKIANCGVLPDVVAAAPPPAAPGGPPAAPPPVPPGHCAPATCAVTVCSTVYTLSIGYVGYPTQVHTGPYDPSMGMNVYCTCTSGSWVPHNFWSCDGGG